MDREIRLLGDAPGPCGAYAARYSDSSPSGACGVPIARAVMADPALSGLSETCRIPEEDRTVDGDTFANLVKRLMQARMTRVEALRGLRPLLRWA